MKADISIRVQENIIAKERAFDDEHIQNVVAPLGRLVHMPGDGTCAIMAVAVGLVGEDEARGLVAACLMYVAHMLETQPALLQDARMEELHAHEGGEYDHVSNAAFIALVRLGRVWFGEVLLGVVCGYFSICIETFAPFSLRTLEKEYQKITSGNKNAGDDAKVNLVFNSARTHYNALLLTGKNGEPLPPLAARQGDEVRVLSFELILFLLLYLMHIHASCSLFFIASSQRTGRVTMCLLLTRQSASRIK